LKWWNVFYTGRRPDTSKPCRWLPRGKGEFRVLTLDIEYILHFCYRQGIWIAARIRRKPGVPVGGIAGVVLTRPNMKKKVNAALGGDMRHLAPVETDYFSKLMPLVEHCAVRKYDDGDLRETGWVTIKTQGAAWVVQIKDPDAACSFAAVGETLDKALETAALLLGCDEAPWELDSFLAASKARKKK